MNTFGDVKLHLPFIGPCLSFDQVRLEDVAICFRCDFVIHDAVISKEPYGRLNVVAYVIYHQY